jgi:S1-C subfamily serine protease/DNA-binding response OmpR family regulator
MRVLLLDLGPESTAAVQQALAGQGYDISADRGLTVEAILARSPEVVIMEATPADVTCCSVVSQLKTGPDALLHRIVMIVHGSALDRARGLELGADDVISFPFDAPEFAARIRHQFRERQPEVELETRLHDALEREQLAVGRRGWFVPAMLVLSTAAVLTALATVLSTRHERKETLQLRAEVARLSTGIMQQDELLHRVELARESTDAAPVTTVAVPDPHDSSRQALADAQRRLGRLESEGRVAETIVRTYGPSVALLHVVVQFLDRDGNLIHVVLDSTGKPLVDDKGMVALSSEGLGHPLELDVFGTGFLVGADGRLLTNHHVAEPWRSNADLKPLFDRGATAFAASYTVYFPDATTGIAATLDKVSNDADLATLRLRTPAPSPATRVAIDDRSAAAVTGDPVVLIGYPTGIEGILARAGTDVTRQVATNAQDVTQIMTQLAAQHLIRPTTTQGHIGDVLPDKIVYDAATTSGGSGGPVFNRDGKVIGINFAILAGFGGSNMAVPVRYADTLLK